MKRNCLTTDTSLWEKILIKKGKDMQNEKGAQYTSSVAYRD